MVNIKPPVFRLYHWILLLTGILLFSFQFFTPEKKHIQFDPTYFRFGLASISLLFFILSFSIQFFKSQIKYFTYSIVFLVTLWGAFLLFINDLAPEYFVRAVIGAVGFSFVFKNYRWFLGYVSLLFVVVMPTIFLVAQPRINPLFLASSWLVLLIILTLIFSNILKYRKREWELKDIYRSVIDNITDAYYLIDTDFNLLKVNEKARLFLENEMNIKPKLGAYLPILISFEDQSFLETKLQLVAKGETQSFIRKYAHKESGKIFYRDITIFPIHNKQNIISYIAITAQDITEKIESERKLNDDRQLLEAVNSNINEVIYRSSLSIGMLYANNAFFDVFKYNKEDLNNLKPEDLYVKKEDRLELVNRISTQGTIKDFEVLLKRKDGSTFMGSINAKSTLQNDGNLIIDGAIRNISTEYKVRNQLIRTEKVLEVINGANISLIDSTDVQKTIGELFSKVGVVLEVDRVYLFENFEKDGHLYMSQKIEWAKNEELKEIDNEDMQMLSYHQKGFKDWLPVFHKNEIICGLTNSFSENLQAIFKEQNIKSILISPVYIGNKVFGFIGFDDCTTEREWTPTIKDILQNLCAAIGAAIKREKDAKELIKSKEKAEELDQIKSKFVSKASHELRTPINGVIGLTEVLLAEKEKFDEESIEYINLIRSNSEKLLHSISNILDFTKKESKGFSGSAEKVNLSDLLKNESELLQVVAKRKGLTFHLELEKNLGSILINPIALSHIINNFVGNAIKFTPKGSVLLKATSNDHEVRIIIQDTGIGIDQAHHQKIFEAFERVDSPKSEGQIEGSGLGLFIANNYIKAFNGKLELESELNKGSTFTITFPKVNL